MSKRELDELDMPGYFLPEDSQFQLQKLRDYMEFLSRLALPRTMEEDWAREPRIPMAELAICLELLTEQAGRVLEEVSWPAHRQPMKDVSGADADTGTASHAAPEEEEGAGDVAGDFVFGVTLEQIDALNLLIPVISAHGDVVAVSDTVKLASHTLPLLGQAIVDGMAAVSELLEQVEAQQLGQGRSPRPTVDEARGAYAAWLPAPGGPSVPAQASIH